MKGRGEKKRELRLFFDRFHQRNEFEIEKGQLRAEYELKIEEMKRRNRLVEGHNEDLRLQLEELVEASSKVNWE